MEKHTYMMVLLSTQGWSLLHFAAYYGHKGIVSDLLSKGLKPNIVTRTHVSIGNIIMIEDIDSIGWGILC